MDDHSLVSVEDLSVEYATSKLAGDARRMFRAVDGVCLDISEGECLLPGRGVREWQDIPGPHHRDAATGRVRHDPLRRRDGEQPAGRKLKEFRRSCQIIFQDPFSSLDPRMTVSEIIGEPLVIHNIGPRQGRPARINELMALCGLDSRFYDRKPHELSGGQRQRVGIARALAVEPSFIVCDEPVSALDASVQAQILNLLMDLKEQMGLTYLFIAHNLGVIKHISDYVAIMYLGTIVESGPRDQVFNNPRHPYTRALLSSAPVPDPAKERLAKRARIVLEGDMPSATAPPPGCRFHTRCWLISSSTPRNGVARMSRSCAASEPST